MQVRKVLHKYKVGQHYKVSIRDDGFSVELDERQYAPEMEHLARNNPSRAQATRERLERHQRAITKQLEKIRLRIDRGALYGQDAIGVRVGKVINKYKVAKHFKLEILDNRFDFEVVQNKVTEEACLDGIYVVRTSLSRNVMNSDDAVRSYKLLSQVERAFRSFKTMDLKVRPIHHRLAKRVRAHIFLCMLAYYVQRHMQEAWRPLLFSDEDQEAKTRRDPVAPAERSEAADRKAASKTLDDGSQVHSFQTLLKLLSSIVKNVCRVPMRGPDAPEFEVVTTPNESQERAFALLKTIEV